MECQRRKCCFFNQKSFESIDKDFLNKGEVEVLTKEIADLKIDLEDLINSVEVKEQAALF